MGINETNLYPAYTQPPSPNARLIGNNKLSPRLNQLALNNSTVNPANFDTGIPGHHIQQGSGTADCGPCAIANMLRLQGQASVNNIRQIVNPHSNSSMGTRPSQMVTGLQQMGINANIHRSTNNNVIADMQRALSEGNPVIAGVDPSRYTSNTRGKSSHYINVISIEGNTVTI
jgi:hypothetical protein